VSNFEILRAQAAKRPILLTGHTGFKGTWMTLLLEAIGIEVVGLSLPPEADSLYCLLGRESKIPDFFGDIRSAEFTKSVMMKIKPSAVIHMAAEPLVIESYAHPERTFETNVMGTVNVLSAARESEVDIVQVITTDKVYKNLNSGKRFSEDDPLAGKDPYSASKVGTETVVSAWKQLYEVHGGTLIHSVRAGNVIGGGDLAKNRLLPDVVRSLQERKPVEIRSLNSTRPWQHVLDPLTGYLDALSLNWKENKQENFNFGPLEKSLSVAEVLKIVHEKVPNFQWVESKSSSETLESKTLDLSSEKATTLLGWKPRLLQEEAVLKTLEWWNLDGRSPCSPFESCIADIQELVFT
jgi:CDP-glucose 4,6-dehydratase